MARKRSGSCDSFESLLSDKRTYTAEYEACAEQVGVESLAESNCDSEARDLCKEASLQY